MSKTAVLWDGSSVERESGTMDRHEAANEGEAKAMEADNYDD